MGGIQKLLEVAHDLIPHKGKWVRDVKLTHWLIAAAIRKNEGLLVRRIRRAVLEVVEEFEKEKASKK
jgi:hypothetical protein